MRRKGIFWLKLAVFLCLLAGLMNLTGTLLDSGDDIMQAASALNHLPRNSVDVFWLGTSHFHMGVVPQHLYDAYGITSTMVTGNAIGLSATYWELYEALLRQDPKVVVLDVYPAAAPYCYHYVANAIALGLASEYPDGNTAFNTATGLARWLPLGSPVKPAAIVDLFLTQRIADESVLQIARLHSRYGDIDRSSFRYLWGENRLTQSFGYMYSNETLTEDRINRRAYTQEAALETYENGFFWTFTDDQLDEVRLLDTTVEALDRIVSLCQSRDLPLVLYATPYMANDAERIQFEAVARYCQERGIPWVEGPEALASPEFLRDIGHLNHEGAIAHTDFWGQYLQAHYDLPDRRLSDDARYAPWRDNAGSDDQLHTATCLANVFEASEYVRQAATLGEDYLIFVSAEGAMGEGATEALFDLLRDTLGLSSDAFETWRAARDGTFSAIVRGGEVLQARYAAQGLDYTLSLDGFLVRFMGGGGTVQWTVDGARAGHGLEGLSFSVYSLLDESLIQFGTFDMSLPAA